MLPAYRTSPTSDMMMSLNSIYADLSVNGMTKEENWRKKLYAKKKKKSFKCTENELLNKNFV